MGLTPILRLRYPELGENADGPAAFQNLALDVENTRTINRGWVRATGQGMSATDNGTLVNAGETRQIMPAQTIAPVVAGWADIDFRAELFDNTANVSLSTWAGKLLMYLNGVQCGEARFHSHGRTAHLTGICVAQVQVPLTMTSMVFGVNLNVDAPSNSAVRAVEWELNVKQYGGPRTA